jgi:hypothetical protein
MNDGNCPAAVPFNEGILYDENEKLFKMWYHAGWFDGIGYAVSQGGKLWQGQNLDIEPGTNRVLAAREGFRRDGEFAIRWNWMRNMQT